MLGPGKRSEDNPYGTIKDKYMLEQEHAQILSSVKPL